jgi:glycosyltransferase involved in cell wall biosynthesis
MFFSIVIPFHNAETYLEEALLSVSAQDFKYFEAILIDDGSTDKSKLIAETQLRRDSRLKLFSGARNGVSSARNKGLEAATGDYVLFLDADDCLQPSSLRAISKLLQPQLPDVLVFNHTEFRTLHDINAKHKSEPTKSHSENIRQTSGFPPKLLANTSPAVWNKAFRRDFIEQQSLTFSSDLIAGTEDLHFVYRALIRARSVQRCNIAFYNYRVSVPNSLSSQRLSQCLESISALVMILKEEDLPPEWNAAIYEQMGRFILYSLRLSPRITTFTQAWKRLFSAENSQELAFRVELPLLIVGGFSAILRRPKRVLLH